MLDEFLNRLCQLDSVVMLSFEHKTLVDNRISSVEEGRGHPVSSSFAP